MDILETCKEKVKLSDGWDLKDTILLDSRNSWETNHTLDKSAISKHGKRMRLMDGGKLDAKLGEFEI